MAVRSRRLCDVITVPANAPVAAITCPAGRTICIKDFFFANTTGGAIIARAYINGVTSGERFYAGSAAANAVVRPESPGWIVLEPGDVLYVDAAAVGLRFIAFGASLFGAPE